MKISIDKIKIILVPFVGFFVMSMAMVMMFIFDAPIDDHPKPEIKRLFLVLINTSIAVYFYYLLINWMNNYKGIFSKWYARLIIDGVIIFAHSYLFILVSRQAVDAGILQPFPINHEGLYIMPVVVLSMIMVILEMILSIEARNKLTIQLAQMEKEQVKSKYGALKEQLDHHFLFNNLSVLSSLIYESTEKADHFIQDFASTYRYVLTINQQQLVSLEDELAFIDKYLSLYNYRFEDGFNSKINIDKQYNNHLLPPLTLQLLVENVIKHNSISKREPLSLEIYTEDDKLIVKNIIRQKLEEVDSTKKGHSNLIEKYRLLNQELPSFGKSGEHYLVIIPLINPNEN